MRKKNKTPLGVIGIILVFIGFIISIPISIKLKQIEFIMGISIVAVIIIFGLGLIVWTFSD